MNGFTKLVPEIVESSIWNLSSDVRIVWITMLAKKDFDGYVRGDANTIARLANVPVASANEALRVFQEPDTSSHTPDNDGRRIAPAPGGWMVLNSDKYQEAGMDDAVRERWRQKKRDYRNKHKLSKTCPRQVSDSPYSSTSTVLVPDGVGVDIQYSHTPTLAEFQKQSEGLCIPPPVVEACYHYYAAAGFCRGQTRLTNFKSLLMAWWAKEQSNPKKQQAARPRMAI